MSEFIDPTMPFLTTFRENPDYNESDSNREMEQLFERQKMIDKVLLGTASVDELLDCLDEQEYDVDDYCDTVIANIGFHIANDLNRFTDANELAFFIGHLG